MITIVSSTPAERTAFAALCESRRWPHLTCDTVRSFRAVLRHTHPNVVLVRHKLADGYSDDIIAATRAAGLLHATKTVVLLAAGTPSAQEARQVALGADCVHRDPARVDVLLEYLNRYRTNTTARKPQPAVARTFRFAGTTVRPADRKLEVDDHLIVLTPRELAFAELLVERQDDVVSYHSMYAELLGRRFAGDTSNMRVLLGKLGRSLRSVGVDLRAWVEVIPKTGYRYHAAGLAQPAPKAKAT